MLDEFFLTEGRRRGSHRRITSGAATIAGTAIVASIVIAIRGGGTGDVPVVVAAGCGTVR